MIADDYYYDWNKVSEQKPWKGQIVEVLTYQPAIYIGQNEFGCDIWEQFPILDKVVYWRILKEKKAYHVIYEQLIQNLNSESSKE